MLWPNRRVSGIFLGGVLLFGAVIYFLMAGESAIQMQEESPEQDDEKRFVGVILADTEDVWNSVFHSNGLRYTKPKIVFFNGSVQSACGRANSSVGPFYCPLESRVYLDLSFLRQLSAYPEAEGDFAAAYVIAHEVGHHIQNLLGIDKTFKNRTQRMDERGRNRLSVRMELQADCFAGVWAKQTDKMKQVLEPAESEEAMNAASSVGYDRIQKVSPGQIVPDSFTHGSSVQRLSAFRRGHENGNAQVCFNSYSFH